MEKLRRFDVYRKILILRGKALCAAKIYSKNYEKFYFPGPVPIPDLLVDML